MAEQSNEPPVNNTTGTAMSSQTTQPLLPMRNLKTIELSPMDALLKKVDGGGLYQWLTFAIFSFHWFIVGWYLLSLGFYFEQKDFTCPGIPDQKQCTDFVCNNVPESQWKYFIEGELPSSLIYQWQPFMVCDYSYIKAILQSLIAAGSMVGFFVFPYYADNYGRKITMIVAWAVTTLGIALLSFANGWIMVGFAYFLIGFGGNPAITLDFSFINQQSLGRTRQYFSIGVQVFFAISQSLVGIILFQLHDWRLSTYIMLGVTAAINLTHFFLIQTPKFMISKDVAKCTELFNRIAKINKRPPISQQEVMEVYEKEEVAVNQSNNIFIIFKYKSLRGKSIATGFMFFGIQIIYYCAILNIGDVGAQPHINQLFLGLSQGFSYLVAQVTIPYLPRKIFSFVGMGLSGGLCLGLAILTIITQSQDVLELIILFLMRFVLCMYWAGFYVYLAELYPTRVRSLAFGWASATGTIGSTGIPYLVLLADKVNLNQWVIPGALGALATLAVFFLPETLNKPMQEEIYEKKKSTIVRMTLGVEPENPPV